ncbi:MAG: alpha/beta hydrolase [Desulfovibrio sp.]|nr:alpha/beta hydrolase [Desulfovibrio sp.]MBI4958450.1 alpha/beta hydrolase [Desulfovibrio sp.]
MKLARINPLVILAVFLFAALLEWGAVSPARASGDTASQSIGVAERAMDKFLFNDRAFVFQTLWHAGVIVSGGADLGELLSVTSRIQDGDTESWYRAWNDMAQTLRVKADAYAAAGHAQSAMQTYLRATNAFRAAGVFLYGTERGGASWQDGRDTFLKAAALSQGRIRPVRIPYEGTTLPGYLLTPDNSGKKRPLFLLQTGLDGSAEDLYLMVGAQVVKRGYSCLIFEGPGQGEMIIKQGLPFRPDWEKVVTPVVDFAVALPEVDGERMAIIGYSMAVPRALAFEKRIKWGIANGGVWSVYDGIVNQLPEAVRKIAADPRQADAVDALIYQEMDKSLAMRHAINQRLWVFKAASPSELFRKLRPYTVADTAGRIKAEMLVVNSNADTVNDSQVQSKQFYKALKTKKTFLEFDASQGAQFHCQIGAFLVSSEDILNWLDERAKP